MKQLTRVNNKGYSQQKNLVILQPGPFELTVIASGPLGNLPLTPQVDHPSP